MILRQSSSLLLQFLLVTLSTIASALPSQQYLQPVSTLTSFSSMFNRHRQYIDQYSRRNKAKRYHSVCRTIALSRNSKLNNIDNESHIIFPGGGLFFYWQAGVIAYLQETEYDLTTSKTKLCGASAGALAATIAATNINCYDATELALQLAEKRHVWELGMGLQGVWGLMIKEWLDNLLPSDAEKRTHHLHLLVTPVPSFAKTRICHFHNRNDLIEANMASVHIPWFLDGNLTYNFRGKPHIDGSFLAKTSDYFSSDLSTCPKLILDFKRDKVMNDRALQFVQVISKQAIWDILEQGKKYAKVMDKNGEFRALPRCGRV